MGPAGRAHLNKFPKRNQAREYHWENKRKKLRQSGEGKSQQDIADIIT